MDKKAFEKPSSMKSRDRTERVKVLAGGLVATSGKPPNILICGACLALTVDRGSL
jgi:hypothetical protein